MANKKVSELTEVLNADLQATDLLLIARPSANANRKLAVSELDQRYATNSDLAGAVNDLETADSLLQTQIENVEDDVAAIQADVQDLDDNKVNRSFGIIEDVLSFTDLSNDPSAPSSGFKNVFSKSDGMYYRVSAGGVFRLCRDGFVSITTKTTNYTATLFDEVINCDASSGNVTIELPTAAGIAGKKYVIKRIDSSNTNEVVIDPNLSQTVDGQTTLDLINQFDSVEIVSDGANWIITANNRIKESVTFSTATATYSLTANTWITAPLSTVYGNAKYSLSSNAWTVKKTGRYRLIMQNSIISGNGEQGYVTYSVNGASESSNWINTYQMDSNAAGSSGHFTEIRDVNLTKGDVVRLRVQCASNTRTGANGRMTVLEL